MPLPTSRVLRCLYVRHTKSVEERPLTVLLCVPRGPGKMDEHTPASLPGMHSSWSWRLYQMLSDDSESLTAVGVYGGKPARDEPLPDCELPRSSDS